MAKPVFPFDIEGVGLTNGSRLGNRSAPQQANMQEVEDFFYRRPVVVGHLLVSQAERLNTVPRKEIVPDGLFDFGRLKAGSDLPLVELRVCCGLCAVAGLPNTSLQCSGVRDRLAQLIASGKADKL